MKLVGLREPYVRHILPYGEIIEVSNIRLNAHSKDSEILDSRLKWAVTIPEQKESAKLLRASGFRLVSQLVNPNTGNRLSFWWHVNPEFKVPKWDVSETKLTPPRPESYCCPNHTPKLTAPPAPWRASVYWHPIPVSCCGLRFLLEHPDIVPEIPPEWTKFLILARLLPDSKIELPKDFRLLYEDENARWFINGKEPKSEDQKEA